MDDNIKVFKPERKFNLPQMPKVGPKMLMAATVTLALLAVVTAGLLTRKQSSKQFTPQKIAAATTATISDNFTAVSVNPVIWTVVGTGVTQSGGQLVVTSANSGVRTTASITGDFVAEVSTSLGALRLTNGGATTYAQIDKISTSIESFIGGTLNSFVVPAGTGVISIRIMRVGSNVQTFYNLAGTWNLLGSASSIFAGTGNLELMSTADSANFDNFTAQVNLVGAPVPTPGTPAACTTQFTVLALAPTPTPTPLATPTPTPLGASPTPTPTPVGTSPTPTPTPITGCGFTCTNNVDCPSTMFCYVGVCRNPSCQTSASCVCSGTAPTPTPTPTPAPITKLTQAGSVLGTWTVSLAGIIMVAFGALMLAF